MPSPAGKKSPPQSGGSDLSHGIPQHMGDHMTQAKPIRASLLDLSVLKQGKAYVLSSDITKLA